MTDGSVSPAPTPSAQEKLRIAGDPGTSPEMLDELSQSRDELIRGAVARNPPHHRELAIDFARIRISPCVGLP